MKRKANDMNNLMSAIKDLQSKLKDARLSSAEKEDLQNRLNALLIHWMVAY